VPVLPPIQPYIIEYQSHKVECPVCGGAKRAALPNEAQRSFGPQLTSLICYLTVVCRMPRRVTERFFEHSVNMPINLGSTQNLWQLVSAAVAQPRVELEKQLKQEPVLNSDETGWRSDGERRYLWALVAQCFVVYTVVHIPVDVGHDCGETENAANIRTESRPTSHRNRWATSNGITGPHRPEYATSFHCSESR